MSRKLRPKRLGHAVVAAVLPVAALSFIALLPGDLLGNGGHAEAPPALGVAHDPAMAGVAHVRVPAALALPSDTTGGVYTKAQAAQGKALYDVECAVCHGPREFMGPVFERRWLTPPVSGIFAHILNTMPQDTPGSLAPAQVARLVAYILELNGKPAGTTPLPVEMEKLAQIRVDTSVTPDSGGR